MTPKNSKKEPHCVVSSSVDVSVTKVLGGTNIVALWDSGKTEKYNKLWTIQTTRDPPFMHSSLQRKFLYPSVVWMLLQDKTTLPTRFDRAAGYALQHPRMEPPKMVLFLFKTSVIMFVWSWQRSMMPVKSNRHDCCATRAKMVSHGSPSELSTFTIRVMLFVQQHLRLPRRVPAPLPLASRPRPMPIQISHFEERQEMPSRPESSISTKKPKSTNVKRS
jgi:hypothetical protein